MSQTNLGYSSQIMEGDVVTPQAALAQSQIKALIGTPIIASTQEAAILNSTPVASVVSTITKTGMSQTEKIIFLLIAVLVVLKLLKVI